MQCVIFGKINYYYYYYHYYQHHKEHCCRNREINQFCLGPMSKYWAIFDHCIARHYLLQKILINFDEGCVQGSIKSKSSRMQFIRENRGYHRNMNIEIWEVWEQMFSYLDHQYVTTRIIKAVLAILLHVCHHVIQLIFFIKTHNTEVCSRHRKIFKKKG